MSMHEIASNVRDACAIAVMAKASVPGKAKTRLVPPLTAEQAAVLNTAFLRDIAGKLLRAGRQVFIDPYIAYAPAGSELFFTSTLPAGIGLIETVAPDFGVCLLHAINTLLGRGYSAACVLNSDSPTLPSAYLIAAAIALAAEGDRAVIGPSTDGGYYLLGLKQSHHRLFEDIEWSTESVFAQTLERADEIGLPVAVLPAWYDVDDHTSLRTLIGELLEGQPFKAVGPHPVVAPHSQRALSSLLGVGPLAGAIGGIPIRTHVA
jgi:rSAM/selenodomain-associated transferase 1